MGKGMRHNAGESKGREQQKEKEGYVEKVLKKIRSCYCTLLFLVFYIHY